MVRFTVLNINNYINNCIIYFFLVIVIIVLFLTSYDKIYSMDFFQRYIFNNVFVYRYDNEDGNFAKNIIDNQLKVANNFTILDNYIGQNGNIEDDNKNNEEKNIEKQNKEYVIGIKPELIEIKNKTTYEIDINNLLSQKLNILQNNLIPTILIIHTHGSESYLYQEHTDYYRNEDIDCNVIRVGHELYTQLTALGYKVIHDTRLYDYPTYSGSYTRSLSSVQEYLINDKNIQIVFDIHRDAMASDEFYAPKVMINDEYVSQIMIIAGTDQGGLEHPNWQENLKLALQLYNAGEQMYPDIYRYLSITKSRYNQHSTQGSLILEVGATGNTLDESIRSMKYFSEIIDVTLKDFLGGVL